MVEVEGTEKVGEDNSDSNHLLSSNCPTLNISSSTKIGGKKYFITACMQNSRLFTGFCDSGADISAVSPKLVVGLPLIELEEPLEVRGFDGQRTTTITHKVELTLDFHPGLMRSFFYVCDVPHSIIGNDILQSDLHLSLETGKKLFHIGSDIIFSRVHATLHPALLVRRSVRWSVGPSVRHTLLFCTIMSTLRSF